jgi:hypothetical protein
VPQDTQHILLPLHAPSCLALLQLLLALLLRVPSCFSCTVCFQQQLI